MSNDQLANTMKSLIAANIDQIINDHVAKFQIPYCTYGIDRNLLAEIEAVKQHSQYLSQNCANFEIMDKKIKQWVDEWVAIDFQCRIVDEKIAFPLQIHHVTVIRTARNLWASWLRQKCSFG